jgi:4-hydroxythreonine-4-phosphate dehydrogenase
MGRRKARLALTIGDPGGIGPEICSRILASDKRNRDVDFVVIGSAPALFREGPWIEEKLPLVDAGESGKVTLPPGRTSIVSTGGKDPPPVGRPTAEGGFASGRAVEVAVDLARRGEVEGIVTGPISKEALRLAGYEYDGHTEMLADLFDAPDCQMMMVDGAFRVVILTRHLPLGKVAETISAGLIETGVKVVIDSLESCFGLRKPRIAVAALNPHAGEGGYIGSEEERVIGPAVAGLRQEGLAVEGPIPADSLFHSSRARLYDAIVALYHDQGMIPFKMTAFERGVNVTVGLPVIRTSVCHGTAYDIAGAGTAGTGSLEAAIDLAAFCAGRKAALG